MSGRFIETLGHVPVQGIMTPMAASGRSRALLILAASAALLSAALIGYQAASDSGADVVSDSSAQAGWKTIEYQGVRVDIPSAWERSDTDDCESPVEEQWGTPGSAGCFQDAGVSFFSSSTYDAAYPPGVRRRAQDGESNDWAGYVRIGEFAVYTYDRDRAVVGMLLDSARATQP
jgi:hypothetical protein